MEHNDRLVGVLPIHFSNALAPSIQIQQFPVLTRPLQVPPSSALSGNRIRARIKVKVGRLEIHIPADTRPEVWNSEKGRELGAARAADDREKNQESPKGKHKEGEEPRLEEVRMRSEKISQKGVQMLGILRNGRLYLHPISETHQLRPALTYLDILSRKHKRFRGVASDSDSDDGPPLDPDDPAPVPTPKQEKKSSGEAREAQVSARRPNEKGDTLSPQGGLSNVRREMLSIIRTEQDEIWQDLDFCDAETEESSIAFESAFLKSEEKLVCKSELTALLKDIQRL